MYMVYGTVKYTQRICGEGINQFGVTAAEWLGPLFFSFFSRRLVFRNPAAGDREQTTHMT